MPPGGCLGRVPGPRSPIPTQAIDLSQPRVPHNMPEHSAPRRNRARPAEQLLLDHLADWSPSGLLVTSLGFGQLARQAAADWGDQAVTLWESDLQRVAAIRHDAEHQLPGNLTIATTPELPAGPFDRIALPISRTGDAEWARETLQAAYLALSESGRLVVSVDNRHDRWLGAQLRTLTPRITTTANRRGIVYELAYDGPLKRIRNFRCRFAFRDGERLIHAESWPGVFAHRRLDLGARKLIEAMHVAPGDTVLDLGCGSGCVAFAAALRAEDVAVHAVDSDARGVASTEVGMGLNELTNVTVEHTATGPQRLGGFQRVLANPPYFSHFRIARDFLDIAHAALAPGGELVLVTQSPDWYDQHGRDWLTNIQLEPAKKYTIVRGQRR